MTASPQSPGRRLERKQVLEIQQIWAELVGAEVAQWSDPCLLSARGTQLTVVCGTLEICQELTDRSSHLAEQLRTRIGADCRIVSLCPSLRPMHILVTGTPGFTRRERLEGVLLETWYDVTQVAGVGHAVIVSDAEETTAGRMAEQWAMREFDKTLELLDGRLEESLPPSRRVGGVVGGAHHAFWKKQGLHDLEARRRKLIDSGADLCIVFTGHAEPLPPAAVLAAEAGIPVRIVTE